MILLTGATGYVGGRLLRTLESLGKPVRCLARRPEEQAPKSDLRGRDILLTEMKLRRQVYRCIQHIVWILRYRHNVFMTGVQEYLLIKFGRGRDVERGVLCEYGGIDEGHDPEVREVSGSGRLGTNEVCIR